MKQKVLDKIHSLVPSADSPLQLHHVLMAVEKKNTCADCYGKNDNKRCASGWHIEKSIPILQERLLKVWNPSLPLEDQDDEVFNLLADVLGV